MSLKEEPNKNQKNWMQMHVQVMGEHTWCERNKNLPVPVPSFKRKHNAPLWSLTNILI